MNTKGIYVDPTQFYSTVYKTLIKRGYKGPFLIKKIPITNKTKPENIPE